MTITKTECAHFLNCVRSYYVDDYASLDVANLPKGKCGLPLLIYAFSLLDLVAYIRTKMVGRRTGSVGNNLEELQNDNRYSSGYSLPPHAVVYKRIRCGSVHEFFTKGFAVSRTKTSNVLLETDANGMQYVNIDTAYAWALHCLDTLMTEIAAANTSDEALFCACIEAIMNEWKNAVVAVPSGLVAGHSQPTTAYANLPISATTPPANPAPQFQISAATAYPMVNLVPANP